MPLPTRRLGNTGEEVSIIGLGGNGLLRTRGQDPAARALIHRAVDLGITYIDAARVYEDCESYLGAALGARRDRVFIASKSAARDKSGAARDLDASLRALRTDRLDLWEVHDVRTMKDVDQVAGPGGALEAFIAARQAGKVRYLGITAHYDPGVLAQALKDFQYDTVQMPVNVAEPHFRSFLEKPMQEARRQNLGIIGMKVLCGGLLRPVGPLLYYALSQPVSVALVGHRAIEELEANVALVEAFSPLSEDEQAMMVEASKSVALRGMYYKRKPIVSMFSLN